MVSEVLPLEEIPAFDCFTRARYPLVIRF